MENAFPEDDQYPLQRDKPGHSQSEETTEDLAAVEDGFQKETDYSLEIDACNREH